MHCQLMDQLTLELKKMNPSTVCIFDSDHGVVTTQFLNMCMSSSSTAAGIFSKMQETLSKHEIPRDNCVGIGLDNTLVNMGRINSIKTKVLSVNAAVSVMRCPCHTVHNIACKAREAYEKVPNNACFIITAHT